MINRLLDRFFTLPRPLQLVLGVGTVGGLIAAGRFVRWNLKVLLVVLAGVVAVALLLLLYWLVLRIVRKRRANPFEQSIRESGRGVPSAVSKPADVAQLDQMRTKFEEGVAQFRARGKDLYSLPWFAIIGEPGSGKTEAIRHCGIGFPPGLGDPHQGTGGTINMDWWFTNQAVILDTAGRLTFGDEHSVDSREWAAFLGLLAKHRPNCPINGLLVAIPADSLIRDSADEIDRKGAKLARQLDLIQRTLGVRFPVNVLVTKADFLNGFRQFYQGMREPETQSQMFGWVNPAPLDAPFEPAAVDQHLAAVEERLVRRRSALLKDPVNRQDESARRTDEVDDLYAFPQSVERISSRLRRYLEQIFVAGEWSAKPLFLRGIFFTSSMQTGDQLDEELAEMLGVPTEAIQEAAWTENHAYFLHDVFTEKVFRESRLVTRASDTRREQQRRRLVVVGTTAAAAVLLTVLAVWSYVDYAREVRDHIDVWRLTAASLETESPQKWAVVEFADDGYKYQGDWPLVGEKKPKDTLATALGKLRDDAEARYEMPLMFAIPAAIVGDLGGSADDRREALARLADLSVVGPLTVSAQERLMEDDLAWSDDATNTLAALIDIRRWGSTEDPLARPASVETLFDVNSLVKFVLPEAKRGNVDEADLEVLQEVVDWVYDEERGDQPWPPPFDASTLDEAIFAGLHAYELYWTEQSKAGSASGAVANLDNLTQALTVFEDAEKELLALDCVGAKTSAARAGIYEAWGPQGHRHRTVKQAREAVDTQLEVVASDAGDDDWKLAELWEQAVERLSTRFDEVHGQLERAASGLPEEPGVDAEIQQALAEIRTAFRTAWKPRDDDEGEQARRRFDGELLAIVGGGAGRRRVYQVRADLYKHANGQVELSRDDEPGFGMTQKRLSEVGNKITQASGALDGMIPAGESGKLFAKSRDFARCIVGSVGASRQREKEVASFLEKIERGRGAGSEIGAMVAEEAQRLEARLEAQLGWDIPLSILQQKRFDDRYHSVVGAGVLRDWAAVHRLDNSDRDELSQDLRQRFAELTPQVNAYTRAYVEYWSKTVPGQLRLAIGNWADLSRGLHEHSLATDIQAELDELATTMDKALQLDVEALGDLGIELADAKREALLATGGGRDKQARQSVLGRWRDLPVDAVAARARLLGERRGPTFVEMYFFNQEDGTYWYNITRAAVELLAQAAKTKADESVTWLRRQCLFPLVPLGPDGAQLNPADLTDVRGHLKNVSIAVDETQDLALPLPEVRKSFSELLEPVSAEHRDWVTRVSRRANWLPVRPDRYKVTVRARLAESRLGQWPYVYLVQGDHKRGLHRNQRGEDFGTVEYFGVDIRVEFRKSDNAFDAGRGDLFVRFPGSWAVLHMLATEFEERGSDGPIVEIEAEDSGSVRLELVPADERDLYWVTKLGLEE